MKTQVLNDFLGILSLVNYIVAYMFVAIALILKWIWQTKDSVKNNESTPEKFSWSYWLRDNLSPKLLSLVQAILVVFIVLRFSSEYFNITFSYGFSFGVGIALDYWVNKVKKMQAPKVDDK